MKQTDLTFIIPNTRWNGKRYWNHIPYAEGILTAVLRNEGFSVNHIDANVEDYSPEELADKIKECNPKIVGIGAMTIEYKQMSHEAFEIVKGVNPDITTIIGGVYPTLSTQTVMKDPNIDYIILSEGEERLLKLMKALTSGSRFDRIDGLCYREHGEWVEHHHSGVGINDLDTIPWPDYSDYDMSKYLNWTQKYTQNFQFRQLPVGMMMTSRGCPYKCTYCAAGNINNPLNDGTRTRSPENVLGEIDQLREKYGVREIVFVDDSLLLPRKRAIAIMEGMAERRMNGSDLVWKSNNLDIRHVNGEILHWMKESGCYQLTVSLESGSAATLKRMNRPMSLDKAVKTLEQMKEYGFDEVCSNFIVGVPGDTWDDIRTTFQFADQMVRDGLLTYALFSIATPLPGTEMAEQAAIGGYLPDNFDPLEFYGFGKGLITTEEFTPDELQVLRAFEWDRINFPPNKDNSKIAGMLGITLQELDSWRRETRRNGGVQIKSVDTTDQQPQPVVGYGMVPSDEDGEFEGYPSPPSIFSRNSV